MTKPTDDNKHAVLSPSGAGKWMECPGAPALEIGAVEESSFYAEEGTAAHLVHSWCIEKHVDTDDCLGRKIVINDGVAVWTNYQDPKDTRRYFDVDEEMVFQVQKSLDRVREYIAPNSVVFGEQRLSIEHLTGEVDAKGTADVIVVTDTELQVHDLKYGRGTRVEAEENKQMLIYALAAYEVYGMFTEIDTIRVVIHQPRLGHHPEYTCTVEELLAFGEVVKAKAALALALYAGDTELLEFEHLAPGMHCHDYYCKARVHCPALRAESLAIAEEASSGSTMTNEELGEIALKIPVAEGYFKEVMSRVNKLILSGDSVPGFKLVSGRQGEREWKDEKEVVKELTTLGITQDKIWVKKIISPTGVDGLKLGKQVNATFEALVKRALGKPAVALATDKRPAITLKPEDDFEDLNKP